MVACGQGARLGPTRLEKPRRHRLLQDAGTWSSGLPAGTGILGVICRDHRDGRPQVRVVCAILAIRSISLSRSGWCWLRVSNARAWTFSRSLERKTRGCLHVRLVRRKASIAGRTGTCSNLAEGIKQPSGTTWIFLEHKQNKKQICLILSVTLVAIVARIPSFQCPCSRDTKQKKKREKKTSLHKVELLLECWPKGDLPVCTGCGLRGELEGLDRFSAAGLFPIFWPTRPQAAAIINDKKARAT